MQEEPVDLRRYVEMALRWWWVLILGPIVGGAVVYSQVANRPPVYEAKATILVQQTQSAAVPTLTDLQTSQRLAATYQRLITTRPVLEQVAEELAADIAITYTPEQLRARIRAHVVSDTQLLEISVKHTNPETAALIAQTAAEVFIDRTQESRFFAIAKLQAAAEAQGLANPSQLLDAQLSALGSLSIVDPAIAATSPLATSVTSILVAAVGAGALLSILIAFGLEHLPGKLR